MNEGGAVSRELSHIMDYFEQHNTSQFWKASAVLIIVCVIYFCSETSLRFMSYRAQWLRKFSIDRAQWKSFLILLRSKVYAHTNQTHNTHFITTSHYTIIWPGSVTHGSQTNSFHLSCALKGFERTQLYYIKLYDQSFDIN